MSLNCSLGLLHDQFSTSDCVGWVACKGENVHFQEVDTLPQLDRSSNKGSVLTKHAGSSFRGEHFDRTTRQEANKNSGNHMKKVVAVHCLFVNVAVFLKHMTHKNVGLQAKEFQRVAPPVALLYLKL